MKKKAKPILILLAGGSGSGKTTVAEEIIKNLPADINGIAICQDRFYNDNASDKNKNLDEFNYDHPNALNWRLMRKQLRSLLSNKMTYLPIYDYKIHGHLKENNKKKTTTRDLSFEGYNGALSSFQRQIEESISERGRGES